MSDLAEASTSTAAAAAAAVANPPAPQDVVQQQGQLPQQAAVPQPAAAAPSVNSAGENLQCQWQGCSERCTSPEALYEHVCERHVGRKSTNNLNLTCAWGQCRTTTVKRDHITSHIRVHVPLKPHKCEFCGKSFKRPQDLKKHVKTHADDSVIMRSPNLEPNGGQRQPQNGLPQVPPSYYAPALGGPPDYAGQHHPNQYYQPHPQPGQHPGYGPVTYYSTAPQNTYDFETRKRGYDALDHFFGQVKRRELDPVNFHNVSRRLFELQGLQLPQIIPSAVSVPAYQPVSVGGSYDNADPIQAYSLPPMGNAKTRGDLTSIDQILEQMQATIYENDTQLAQAGVAQPGASYVAYRTSNSPPSHHLASAASHSTPSSMLQHQHQGSIASATDASTPGLTPPSSAQSYTSGQSPLQNHAAPSSSAMYPTLPSSTGDIAYAAANAATLSGMYDSEDHRRRYSGGMLQRAAPAKDRDAMDVASDGSLTPPASAMNKEAKGKGKASMEDSLIDPALSGDASTPKSESKEPDSQQIWVENMRLIEWMRDFIKKKLEREDYDDEDQKEVTAKADGDDTDMTGTDDHKDKSDHEQLYPVLRHVEESA
ncbi:hypothetical protein, variant 1 [Exophiala mesophila]|uniref:pH-response transcription factor pacC/RIM101 n=1 Tax=Exophiala mesophila TaxID=212818 RepID=A0A0D1XIU7_EXOME|nr:hypothetical protein, variant 1 [Exophiala mesophila]KIV88086.1 hypothetical protein, variant 1 [Exophiala mesophila]